MKVKIRAFGDLMSSLGNELVIELKVGAKLKDLISILMEKISGIGKGYIGRYNTAGSDLTILLNGLNVQTLKKNETVLKDGDIVSLLPPLGGG